MSANGLHVALLRGINVGGKHLVPMKSLAAMFEHAGCSDVVTYIQSGNVVFRAKDAAVRRLAGAIRGAIEERFGLRVPVVLRSAAELREVARQNVFEIPRPARAPSLHVPKAAKDVPVGLSVVGIGTPFLAAGAAPGELHVAFLADLPAAAAVAALDPKRSPPDELVVRGREVYLRLPNGVARTKLTNAYLDSKLGTTCTMRSWKTVLKLAELCG
ncbi:MAG: DUF1697 domain-containing protein [Deltaproteobacteria bacterium]|nr:DUF1697 domain-containing protein [Deltaproteobacteria bacterium]